MWKTNAEYISELLPSFSGMKAYGCASLGAWNSTNNCFAYNAWNAVSFTSTTQATVESAYNNVNLQLGLYEIWGIC